MDLAVQMDLSLGANPIRKVVTLMQDMQKEIEAEGAKEKELFDKFMCFCSSSGGDMGKAVADLKAQIDELGANLKAGEAEKTQTGQELISHKQDRETANGDLEEATTLREKESGEFQELKADSETNIQALSQAIPAIEKGMGGAALLQLPLASRLKNMVNSYPNVDAMDRHKVASFLEASADDTYAPASGQIVGILKAMKDDMEANLKTATDDEDKSAAGFADLKASKEKEIAMATEAIETKTARAGELAVSVVQTKDALEDATAELAETEKYSAGLKEQCATKEKEWGERCKMRADEIAAISEAIGILNDDDALDVFKKAMPSSLIQKGLGLLQQSGHRASKSKKAQAILAGITSQYHSTSLKLMLFTLNSQVKLKQKGGSFGEVIKLIDDMVVLLGKQQSDDDKHKAWCQDEFDKSADEEKATQTKLSQVDAGIAEITDTITTLMDEINTLTSEVATLDHSVAEATEQRKEEHAEYVNSASLGEAAISLVGKAKNRMQKFYNPTLYKASSAALVQTSTLDGFVQIHSHKSNVAPPPAPETFGEYKKGEKSAGVIGMMDSIIKDLENEMKAAEFEEKTAQKDYAELMSDSQATRAQDVKSITDKEAAKAELEGKLVTAKQTRAATMDDLNSVQAMIQDLHKSCDFLMSNFDLRKESRTDEIESLKNAKAVLSGANFAL